MAKRRGKEGRGDRHTDRRALLSLKLDIPALPLNAILILYFQRKGSRTQLQVKNKRYVSL